MILMVKDCDPPSSEEIELHPGGGYVNLGCPLLGRKTAAVKLRRGAFRGHRRQNRHTCEQNPEGREAPDRTSAHGSEEVSAM
ncbi:hypothetical protein KOW79_021107 [Hemibagrus wyckioides]|uniref:Uncharacterized protein n=1 Tax=Hemibagrus wyckioides TaxID=337641 RepID=A0A9D3SDN7_9TELE|nr:hypothetical protein KOW79_021107 [Hemibagrus wyckioides]